MKVAFLADGGYFVLAVPYLVTLIVGCVFIGIALKDGTDKNRSSVRVLPTDHLTRQLHSALRPQRATPPAAPSAAPPARSRRDSALGRRAGGTRTLRAVPRRSRE